MSRFRSIVPGVLAVLIALPGSASRVPAVAFTDVTVIAMDGTKPRSGQTVVTANGRIDSVGPAGSTRVPDLLPIPSQSPAGRLSGPSFRRHSTGAPYVARSYLT